MKKKICFVGFSGEEYELLQSVLARVAGSWDFVFFTDGAAALVALGAGPVDAVVVSAGRPPPSNPGPCVLLWATWKNRN